MSLKELTKYTVDDIEKRRMIYDVTELFEEAMLSKYSLKEELREVKVFKCRSLEYHELTKVCPKCGRKYPDEENFCFDCQVRLKKISGINVGDIEINPDFKVKGTNEWHDFEDIFSQENLDLIDAFDFKIKDFNKIIRNIKSTVLKRMDRTVKDNHIPLNSLSIEDKVMLFAKSFVNVEYKSYGRELGYFEFNRICVDDRQLAALQITTLLHELSHFILKEIIAEILCNILDATKTPEMESIAIFILSYTPINQLIDEYAAHTVEGRFTLFGYQDYSSFLNIQKQIDLPAEEIEMIKTIGNSFSVSIKDILETFIDDELLDEIKDRFKKDILDRPDYDNLAMENCTLLNDNGMVRAIGFIVRDGFMIATENIGTLKEYNQALEVEK